jgi:hypothetical protein
MFTNTLLEKIMQSHQLSLTIAFTAILIIVAPALAQETATGEHIYTGPIPNNRAKKIVGPQDTATGEHIYTKPIPNNRNEKTEDHQVNGSAPNINTAPQNGTVQRRRR